MIKIYIKDEFKDAAKKDKLTLSDENENIAKSALLETSNNGALAALYKSNDVPVLPYRVDICNEDEITVYVLILI